LGNIFNNNVYGLPLGSYAYPVAAEPVIRNTGPVAGYPIQVDRQNPLWPVFFTDADWFAVRDNTNKVVGASPRSRDGWMFAVCPAVPSHAGPLPTQAEMAAANDYLFILFPYRKILPTHICHQDFRFIRVKLKSGIVDAYWDEAATPPKEVAVKRDNGEILPMINSPLVRMSDPTTPPRTLAQGVAIYNGNNRAALIASPDTSNPLFDGWWLGVANTAGGDVSPALGCSVYRDRLK
jgi:hypothetical protein